MFHKLADKSIRVRVQTGYILRTVKDKKSLSVKSTRPFNTQCYCLFVYLCLSAHNYCSCTKKLFRYAVLENKL